MKRTIAIALLAITAPVSAQTYCNAVGNCFFGTPPTSDGDYRAPPVRIRDERGNTVTITADPRFKNDHRPQTYMVTGERNTSPSYRLTPNSDGSFTSSPVGQNGRYK